MIEGVNNALISFFVEGKQFVENFKNDEKALSGVVVAVLLILVAVLAVGLLSGLLGEWLNELWLTIVGESDNIKMTE